MHDLTHILADPAHWVAEGVFDAVYAIPAVLWANWRVRKHDRKVHKIKR